MGKVLSLTLRPKSLDRLYGQAELVAAIRTQAKTGRLPNAWMFIGETGSGKTTTARIVARALNCTHVKRFGAWCKLCYLRRDTLNIYEVNAAHFKGIDAMKDLVKSADAFPIPPALRRVYILDEAQQLSNDAQNLLLKYFEDPADTTVWIINTTDPRKILSALRGRCGAGTYALQPLRGGIAEAYIIDAAKKAGITRKLDDFIEFIHKEHVTSARNILGALEQFAAGIDPDRTVVKKSNINTMEICKGLVAGEWNAIRPNLERALAEDVDYIRASVIGFLRTLLLSKNSNVRRKLLAYGIRTLSGVNWSVGDPTVQFSLLCALLHDLCEVYPDGDIRKR